MKIAIDNSSNLGTMSHQNEMIESFIKYTKHTISPNPDIAWAYSMQHFPMLLKFDCLKIATIHHIDPLKLKDYEYTFDIINKKAAACIVPNDITKKEASKYISVPIHKSPYWIIENRTIERQEEEILNIKNLFKDTAIRIGYFQKDSEADTNQPKLCKGPDIFLEIVKELNKTHNIRVILSGYGRKYIRENLIENKIKHTYFEKFKNINNLYDVCDWYFVTSRTEGGPMAILEASYRKIKILSTPVGIASDVLHKDCICSSVEDFVDKFNKQTNTIDYNYNNVQKYLPLNCIKNFDTLLETIYKENNEIICSK